MPLALKSECKELIYESLCLGSQCSCTASILHVVKMLIKSSELFRMLLALKEAIRIQQSIGLLKFCWLSASFLKRMFNILPGVGLIASWSIPILFVL